jgi:hypothetical protein
MRVRDRVGLAIVALLIATIAWRLASEPGGARSDVEPGRIDTAIADVRAQPDLAGDPPQRRANEDGVAGGGTSARTSGAAPPREDAVGGSPWVWTLRGRVIDQGGRGAPGLTLWLQHLEASGALPSAGPGPSDAPREPRWIGITVSDEEGRFEFSVATEGKYDVSLAPADLEGPVYYAAGPREALRTAQGDVSYVNPITFEVFRRPSADEVGRFLIGVVVDAEGAPVEHARLEARARSGARRATLTGFSIRDGFFALGPVDVPECRLEAWGPEPCDGDASERAAKPGVELRLVLSTRVSVAGRIVTTDGEPCSRAMFRVRSASGEGFSVGKPLGADGSFELCLDEGNSGIAVFADPVGYGELEIAADSSVERHDLVVTVERCAVSFAAPLEEVTLSFRLDRDGRPIREEVFAPFELRSTAIAWGVPPGSLDLIATGRDEKGTRFTWRTSVDAVAGATTHAPPWGPVEIDER